MRYRVDKPFERRVLGKRFPVGSFVETEKVDGNFVWLNGCYIATAKEFFGCCAVVDQQPETNYEQKARLIVTEAFKDKTDKAGRPYIEHLEAVCGMVESEEDEVKAIAMLHDILEDCPEWTFERLVNAFNERIAEGVFALTKFSANALNYAEYIELVKANPDAILVKIADLRHNMDITRLPVLGDYEIKRLKKYHAAYLELIAIAP